MYKVSATICCRRVNKLKNKYKYVLFKWHQT